MMLLGFGIDYDGLEKLFITPNSAVKILQAQLHWSLPTIFYYLS